MSDKKLCVSIKEAARLLSLGRTTVYGMASRGGVPVRKIGGRSVVPLEALEELIRTVPPRGCAAAGNLM